MDSTASLEGSKYFSPEEKQPCHLPSLERLPTFPSLPVQWNETINGSQTPSLTHWEAILCIEDRVGDTRIEKAKVCIWQNEN